MRTRLQPVDAAEDVPTIVGTAGVVDEPAAVPQRRAESALTSLLVMSLRALSQRSIVALNSLADLGIIATAFVLWCQIIGNPTVLQLVGLGMYAVFALAAIYARRRGA